jgi:peptide methionine sulfoxide reductase MsrA
MNRIRRYESVSEILQALVAYGCFWGREQHR